MGRVYLGHFFLVTHHFLPHFGSKNTPVAKTKFPEDKEGISLTKKLVHLAVQTLPMLIITLQMIQTKQVWA